MKILIALGLFILIIPQTAISQTQEAIPITRITEPITLDGLSTELAWEDVESFPMVIHEPIFGAEPTERTEMLAAYDDEYIYFAMRGYDSNPERIRGNVLIRDRFGSDDYFEVMIDTFNDNENAMIFTTNPNGIRRDVAISNDATGPVGSWLNPDFNTFWDTAVTRNQEGWFAEVRIPFSSLRFQDDNGRVVMGLSMHRIIVRKTERAIFPAIEPNTNFAYLKPSRMQKIVLEGVESQRPVYIRPYVLGGIERLSEILPDDSGYTFKNSRMTEAGLDVKYGLTNNLTLDLTVNTDFAQVEADDQQVNLSRFSLFFPEKRQFFQERAGLFEFRTGGQSRLFHSRRIGLTGDGEMVRILGGARVVGKVGEWDVGLLNMQTDRQGNQAAENFGAIRLRRQVFNPYSYAGLIATSRIGVDGQYNMAYGVDGSFRLYGDDYLTFQWAHTFDETEGFQRSSSPSESGRISAAFERRLQDGFGYETGFVWSGPDYNPGMGFIQRTDFTQFSQELSYTYRHGEESRFISNGVSLEAELFYRNIGWDIETVQVESDWGFLLKSGNQGSLGLRMTQENLLFSFNLDQETVISAGDYTFYQLRGSYSMSRAGLFRMSANAEIGEFYDGEGASISLQPSWNVSPHLELGGSYNFVYVDFADRNQQFTSHLARLRLGIPFNTQVSTNLFLQYNSVTDSFSTNARFRYNFREGNDLWIVYNEDLNTNTRPYMLPEMPRSRFRTFMIKYTHTFII
tara:strand:- start:59213 stop:61432 length:2220 start_codon:yes stop_codon:yes gene_type:complete